MYNYFGSAYTDLLFWEGGYNHVAGDKGGATNHGISLRFLKNLPLAEADINHDGHVTKEDIKTLSLAKAAGFYRKHFWQNYGLECVKSQPIATKLLNIFVNMRGRTAGRVAQRALRACCIDVFEDGYLGPLSYSAINDLISAEDGAARYIVSLRSEQAAVYRLIVAHNPTQQKFFDGWLNRAYS